MQAQSEQPPLMSFSPVQNQLARRQRAAQLLQAVINEEIEPRIAINRWPEPQQEQDASLDCAYLALWHFEADEEKQKTELFYMDAQLELLRQMARQLQTGQELPPYILSLYRGKKTVRFFWGQAPWLESRYFLQKLGAEIASIWGQALALCGKPRF